MKKLLKSIYSKLITPLLIYLYKKTEEGNYAQIFFGQEGEDLILNRFFGYKNEGFYIDIGAHHPFRFSNTYIFYKRGWRGINIEANPLSIDAFKKHRPNDINLNFGISDKEEELIYYSYNEPALNTFSEQTLERRHIHKQYKIVSTKKIKLYPLAQILNEYIASGQAIDFMSIDVEGFDLKVLESNNWEKYRPKVIVVESFIADLENIKDCPIYQLLSKNNYQIISKIANSCIYNDKC
jgi:FkbM family methyltransferase